MRKPCHKCKFKYKPIDQEPCKHCSDEYIKSGDHPAFQWAKSPTNYDLLIRKTPEELAEWFNTMNGIDKICPDYGAHNCQESCRKCWLNWLEQEATNG